jgi:flagellin-like protein
MKMLRSRKALSPVVASIILIAVTVAVSIAVAAWMGALTFNFMATEQGQITNLSFDTTVAPYGNVLITFNNTGTTAITMNEVWVNNQKQTGLMTWTGTTTGTTVAGNSGATCLVVMTGNPAIVPGAQYEVKLLSSKGNTFVRTMSAPS